MADESSAPPFNRVRTPLPPPLLFFFAFLAGIVAGHFARFTLLPDAIGIRLGSALGLFASGFAIGVVVLFVALDRLVVSREERFLSDLFGEDYLAYRKRVRRRI